MTNGEIAKVAGVAPRTVRAHTVRLVELGLLDRRAEVFPGHRFRWSEKAAKGNTTYLTRIGEAADVFGIQNWTKGSKNE
jgi:DNA-binding IclR family transcriptional regulator